MLPPHPLPASITSSLGLAMPGPVKVITVRHLDLDRRIAVEGTPEVLKDVMRVAFSLRTNRLFCLEDEDGVLRPISPALSPGTYSIVLDEGVSVKIYIYDDHDHLTGNVSDRTFGSEDEFQDFLARKGWTGLREVGGYRDVDTIEQLVIGAAYQRAQKLSVLSDLGVMSRPSREQG
eukprot:SM000156S02148  [mRNA]  locus=s156:220780:221513:+ [translate_table: standard]